MVLCFGKCFRVSVVYLGPLFIWTVAIISTKGFSVTIGIVGLMARSPAVRWRWCIVRHGLEYLETCYEIWYLREQCSNGRKARR